MSELARKKKVRASHKSSATRMVSKVEDLVSSADTTDTSKLNQLNMSLREKLEEIKVLDGDILSLVEDSELENEIAQADLYKERLYSTLILIEKATRPRAAVSTVTPSTSSTTTGPPAPSSTHINKVRLPKLTIKPFNGKLTAWPPFWDSFKSAIHENPDLSKVDKFNYLRSMVTHGALEAISGLTLTAPNYDEAITILEKRFGNKQLIVNKHMDQLLNTDGVTSPHDVKGLRQLYDTIESNVRSLNSLGVKAESYGSLLSSVVMNKLPSELRLIVSRKFGSTDSWDFSALLIVVEEEIQARERSSARTTHEGRRPREYPTGATLFSDATSPRCCFCQQGHSSQDCPTVTGIESRRETLRRTGRCYICLGRGHVSRTCRSRIKCLSCRGRHHVAICPSKSRPRSKESRSSSGSETTPTLNAEAPSYNPPSSSTLCTHSDKRVLLQTAQVTAFNPDRPSKRRRVRIVMDTGSQQSYIADNMRKQLALTAAGEKRMTIATFGTAQGQERTCEYVKVGLKLRNGQSQSLTLFSVPTICEPLTRHPMDGFRDVYPHLKGLDLADTADGAHELHVDILIGSDSYWELVTGRVRRGTDGPVAIETRLGWVLSGPIPASGQTDESINLMTHTLLASSCQSEEQTLNETMKSFWELESFGIPPTDRSLYDELCDTIKFRDGRYEVQLPWKTPRRDLPNNFELSQGRLNGLLRRLRHDSDILHEYDSIIKTQLQQGIVELVDASAAVDVPGVHYLPHRAVIRRDKQTTKLRIVYDASAKSTGPSLNDCLHPGPKFDQKILDILNRFRVHRIAITADIEKAFLMISVTPPDREFLRFLWVDDPNKVDPSIVVYRFTRVVFGVTSSPFLLNATVRHHLELHSESHGDLVAKVLRSIYVDDVVTGSQSEEQAYSLYVGAKTLLKTGAFNLRKFTTNSSALQAKVDAEEAIHIEDPSQPSRAAETFSQVTLGGAQRLREGEQKVLGVAWNVSADQIIFTLEEIADQARRLNPTKRNVTSVIGRFYDPLGFLAPVVICFKVFMQSLFEAKIGWDDTLPEPLITRWRKLVSALSESQPMTLPRCYLDGVTDDILSYQLYGYCDASLSAYAAVIYSLLETEHGFHMRFVVAKTRVAPLKRQSIPRLELLSAVLLARLMDTTRTSLSLELEISSCHCFHVKNMAV